MATLYEMTNEVADLYDLLLDSEVDDETAEQVLKDHIEGIGADLKIEAYSQIIKQLEADSNMYASEKKRVEDRKKVCDNRIKQMKNALAQFLIACNEKKMQSGTFTVSLRTTKSVEITDGALVPDTFLIPQPSKINKTEIKKMLTSGTNVAGCSLVENVGVMIR